MARTARTVLFIVFRQRRSDMGTLKKKTKRPKLWDGKPERAALPLGRLDGVEEKWEKLMRGKSFKKDQ
jgi:hypothetical protein